MAMSDVSLTPSCRYLLAVITLACSTQSDLPPPDVQQRTRRESRGDTVVVSHSGVDASAKAIALEHQFTIGEQDSAGPTQFTSISFVCPLANGGILIDDGFGATTRVMQFDSAGNFVRTIGRRGNGPGEYRAVSGLGAAPDGRLFVWGFGGGGVRVSVFDSTGAFLKSWPAAFFNGRFVNEGRAYTEGTINDPELPDSVDGFGRKAQRRITIRNSLDGVTLDTLVGSRELRAMRSSVPPREGNSGEYRVMLALKYAPAFMIHVSPRGYYVSGTSDRFSIALMQHSKPLLIESDRVAIPVEEDERGDEYRRLRARSDEVRMSDIARSKPFFKGIRVDHDGRIWVWLHQPSVKVALHDTVVVEPGGARFRWEEQAISFDVFEPGGEFLGSVSLPNASEFAAAKGDKLWVVLKDENEVPRLARYQMKF